MCIANRKPDLPLIGSPSRICGVKRVGVVTYKVHAYEGFCEDLARQNVVARLSQLQLRFRRRHIWVSTLSHIDFSHRRGVLKTTI